MYKSNPISIDDIWTVVNIIRGHSMADIARESGFSMAKVKASIKRIEQCYHCVLFSCVPGKRLVPTSQASLLLETFEGILRKYDEGMKITLASRRQKALRTIPIRLSLMNAFICDAEGFYSALDQNTSFEYVPISKMPEEALVLHEIDFAILAFPDPDPRLTSIVFHQDTLCAMVPDESPFASKAEISLDDLSGHAVTYVCDSQQFYQKEQHVYHDVLEKSVPVYTDPRDLSLLAKLPPTGMIVMFDVHRPHVPATHRLIPIAGQRKRDICFVIAKDREYDPCILPLYSWFMEHEIR